jgi:hypothetical protein
LARVTRIGLVVGLLGALLAGCGGHDDDVPQPAVPTPLSERELTWVRGYSTWAITFWDEGFRPRPGAGVRRVCLEPLDEAGAAPTSRLRAAEREARRACRHLAAGSVNDAEAAAEAADESMYPLLLENQKLKVRSGVATTASHIDLDLGFAAGGLSGEPVEVRCWNGADWKRFIGERNAWESGEDDYDDIDGTADLQGGRMHLRLEHCNILVSLRREEVAERSAEGLVDAGVALLTYAHEIGHFAAPEASEAEVECAAYRYARRLDRELELTPTEVELLLDAYRAEVAPTLPNSYRDPNCRA